MLASRRRVLRRRCLTHSPARRRSARGLRGAVALKVALSILIGSTVLWTGEGWSRGTTSAAYGAPISGRASARIRQDWSSRAGDSRTRPDRRVRPLTAFALFSSLKVVVIKGAPGRSQYRPATPNTAETPHKPDLTADTRCPERRLRATPLQFSEGGRRIRR